MPCLSKVSGDHRLAAGGRVSSLSTCHLPFGIWCQPPHPLPLLSTTWLSLQSPLPLCPFMLCCYSWRFHCYPPSTNTHPLETSASPALPLPPETEMLRSFCLAHRQLLSSKPVLRCIGPSHVPSSCFLTQILLSSVPRVGSKPTFRALYLSYPVFAVLNLRREFCLLNLCLSLSSFQNITLWYTREQNTSLTLSVSWGLSTNSSHRLTASKYSISSVFLKRLNFPWKSFSSQPKNIVLLLLLKILPKECRRGGWSMTWCSQCLLLLWRPQV